jgi:hypothetical protein
MSACLVLFRICTLQFMSVGVGPYFLYDVQVLKHSPKVVHVFADNYGAGRSGGTSRRARI